MSRSDSDRWTAEDIPDLVAKIAVVTLLRWSTQQA